MSAIPEKPTVHESDVDDSQDCNINEKIAYSIISKIHPSLNQQKMFTKPLYEHFLQVYYLYIFFYEENKLSSLFYVLKMKKLSLSNNRQGKMRYF